MNGAKPMTDVDREVGRLEARMETVETELQGIRADVREIRDALVSARGGWFILTAALSMAAASGALLSTYLQALLRAQ
jgi:chromosome condensin MukBEF ATPase and DNA-binding subunit MukB